MADRLTAETRSALMFRDLACPTPDEPLNSKSRRIKEPKSWHGRREVPLSRALILTLRAHLASLPPGDGDALAFPTDRGTPLHYSNALRRVLRPTVEEADAPWAAFHAFRHTFASLHLARGTNVVQLSRLLGHHSPDFTLRVYAHLIPGDETPVLDVDGELGRGANEVDSDEIWSRPVSQPLATTHGKEKRNGRGDG